MDGKPKIIALAALAALVPAAACAKGGGQDGAQGNGAAASGGMTLAQFEARRGGRMMAADSDGDGRVSRAEFVAAQQGKGDSGKRFDRLDANRDGFLDKTEINAMLARRFSRMDANGDGVVSRDERAAMHRNGNAPGANGQPGAPGADGPDGANA